MEEDQLPMSVAVKAARMAWQLESLADPFACVVQDHSSVIACAIQHWLDVGEWSEEPPADSDIPEWVSSLALFFSSMGILLDAECRHVEPSDDAVRSMICSHIGSDSRINLET